MDLKVIMTHLLQNMWEESLVVMMHHKIEVFVMDDGEQEQMNTIQFILIILMNK